MLRTKPGPPTIWSLVGVFALGIVPNNTFAQLEVPVQLVLDGPMPEHRQVLGLADPDRSDALISAGAERRTVTRRAEVTGTSVLSGSFTPPLEAYGIGSVVFVIPDQANQAGPSLDIDDLGPVPLVKKGGLPLDSADLTPGIPFKAVYDGSAFQLISALPLTCPYGYSMITPEYCIEDSSRQASTFFEATNACSALNARLCTISEWAFACYQQPGFLGTVVTAEWVDHAANNAATAKVAGAGNNGQMDLPGTGCNYGGWGPPANPFRFRCCRNR